MRTTKPSMVDRIRIKRWSKEKRCKEIQARALQGDVGWVLYLLESTDYATIQDLLNPRWWLGDAAQRVTVGKEVALYLLGNLPPEELPRAERLAGIKADFDHTLLRLKATRIRLK